MYAILALGVVGGGIYFVHHERVIGEQKIEAADKKVADAAIQHNLDVQVMADDETAKNEALLAQTLATPVDPVPPARLCRVAPARRPMPSTAPSKPGSPAAAISGAANSGDPQAGGGALEAGPDIGAALVTVGRNSDAVVRALQAENASIRKEMKPK